MSRSIRDMREEGDLVKIVEVRRLAKTVAFVTLGKVKTE